MKQVLKPLYYGDFQCIGASCEDTCCAGWTVTVDKLSFKKYKKTKNSELKEKLNSNIVRDKSLNNDAAYAKIKMVGDRCSFLTSENLCEIQLDLGEKSLCHTCSTYPRDFNKVNDLIELSLTASCPEAARLILNRPEGIDFELIENNIENIKFFNKNIQTEDNDIDWELRSFCIFILQNRTLTLENRLVTLGLFSEKLVNLKTNQAKESEIYHLMANYDELMKSKEYIQSLNELPQNHEYQIKMAIEVIESRINNGGISNKRYNECLEDLVKAFEIENFDLKRQVKIYEDTLNNFYTPNSKEYSIILENYLVNELYSTKFPILNKNIRQEYLIIVVKFLLIRLHVLSLLALRSELKLNDFVKIIQSLSKVISHNPQFIKKIINSFGESQLNSMAHLAMLIK